MSILRKLSSLGWNDDTIAQTVTGAVLGVTMLRLVRWQRAKGHIVTAMNWECVVCSYRRPRRRWSCLLKRHGGGWR